MSNPISQRTELTTPASDDWMPIVDVSDTSESPNGTLKKIQRVNVTSTAAEVLTKLLTVDGSGSGIDADLLDGHDSAYFQAADAELTALAGLVSAANSFPYFTGSGTAALLVIVSAIRTLLASTDLATFQSNAGLAIGTNVQAWDADLDALAAISGSRGDVIYYGASGWTRLAKGTSGQLLQIGANDPAWATVASSGGLTLLSSTSYSAAASVVVDSVFSATYDDYLVVLEVAKDSAGTSGDYARLRMRSSASDDTGSNYGSYLPFYRVVGGASTGANSAYTATNWPLINQSGASLHGGASIWLRNPNLARWTLIDGTSTFRYTTSDAYMQVIGGALATTTQYDGIKLYGDTNISGEMRIYGLQKS